MKTFTTREPPSFSVSPATESAMRDSSSDLASSVTFTPMVFGAMSLVTRSNRPGVQLADALQGVGSEQVEHRGLHPGLPELPDLDDVHPDRGSLGSDHLRQHLEEPPRRCPQIQY